MTCSKYPPMLSRFLDRELSPRESAEVESHLAQCGQCRGTLEYWRVEGKVLRNYLSRHRLHDEFVGKVLSADLHQNHAAGLSTAASARRRSWLKWIPAAAAILAAAVIVCLLFPGKDGTGYARVIDPGKLEVLQGGGWVRATAGEVLHPGDWLRNPVPSAPEIMWSDSSRLTVTEGTLAQIPNTQIQLPGQVLLMSGSLLSEVQDRQQDFQVRTPVGTVTASSGKLTVRVGEVALPHLEVRGDRSVMLTGKVIPVGSVSVLNGKATIQAANSTSVVSSGETATFSESSYASATRPMPVAASLRPVSRSSAKGMLTADLTATAEGLCVDVAADNISVKRLLEWTTATGVRGGEETTVSGTLRYPANATAESIVTAIAKTLGLPISIQQEKVSLAAASRQLNQTPTLDWSKGDYTLEKSQNGLISFDLRGVPGDQAFRILRTAVADLPELSPEAQWIPVTLHASALSPGETAAWVTKALGLQVQMTDFQIRVIEIGSPTTGVSGTQVAGSAESETVASAASSAVASQDSAIPANAGSQSPSGMAIEASANAAEALAARTFSPSLRSLWSILGGNMTATGYYVAAAPTGGNQSQVKGKTSKKTVEIFGLDGLITKPEPSQHLIWPALSYEEACGAGDPYVLLNALGMTASTLWSGYDRSGELVARYALLVNGASSLTLVPFRDLPSDLGEGGHWEMLSTIPLVGSREGTSLLGLPVEEDKLLRDWSIPAAWIGDLGGRLWFANPEKDEASLVLTIVQNGKVVSTVQLTIAPHGGISWPEANGGTGRVPRGTRPGATVVLHALQGSLAIGLAR